MSAAKKAGVIYILTNPSFPDYVKIGYATNIENRLKQLNRSECIPFAFRVYATYDVSAPLQDKELHSLIDRLNPDLRAIDTFDGKTRTKEFYAMTKEDAYALLESIAKLSGTMDKLQRLTPEGHEIADEEVAAEIQEEAKERKAPFSFIKCGIPMGAEVVLQNHPEVVAVVKDDRQIEYQGKTYSLSALAQKSCRRPIRYKGRCIGFIREENCEIFEWNEKKQVCMSKRRVRKCPFSISLRLPMKILLLPPMSPPRCALTATRARQSWKKNLSGCCVSRAIPICRCIPRMN